MQSQLIQKLLFGLILLSGFVSAQPVKAISLSIVSKGDSLMNRKEFTAAIAQYKKSISHVPKEQLSDLYMKLGKGFFYRLEYDSAYRYYEKASEAAYNQADFKTMGQAQNNLGVIHAYLSEYNEALNSYRKALEAYTVLEDDSLIARVLYNIGNQYNKASVYDKAIEYIIKSTRLFEETKQQEHLAKAYQALGNLFRYEKDYEKSLEYHRKAIDIRENLDDKESLSRSYNDIGNTYKYIENYDQAIDYYKKSVELKQEYKNSNIAVSLQNIGEIYLKKGEYGKAEEVLLEALVNAKEARFRKNYATILVNLGKLYTLVDQDSKALLYLNESKQIAEVEEMNDVLLDCYLYLKEFYESTGRYKQALKYIDLYNIIKEEILNAEKSRITREMQIRYEVEKKQQEITLLSKENIIKEAQLEKETFKNQALLLGLLFLIVLIILLVYAYRQSKRNAELQKAFLHDTQHRTKNFLQTLISLFSFQANQIDDPRAKAAVKQGESRLNAMMMIHRSLSQVTDNQAHHFNFSDYSEKLIHQLKTSYQKPDCEVSLQLDLGEVFLDTDKATPLALIVNELVSNAFKYGLSDTNAPLLKVKMKKKGKNLTIVIKDNGKGIKDINIDELKSSGLKLVKLFTRQLKGELQINNSSGAEFRIEVQV